jgi:hypothetical protein
MSDPKRRSVRDVRGRLDSGAPINLVCAYPTEQAFRKAALEGAISFPEFERRLPALPKEAEIIFY